MREIFFTDEKWTLAGDGDFTGTFRLFDGGHDLSGTFTSPIAGVNDYRFPALNGSLRWTQNAFDVWNAGSKFYGGDAKFPYSIKPLGVPAPPTQRFDATVARTDLAPFTDFEDLKGLRFAGAADGHVFLEWPSGKFSERRGGGQLVGDAAAGRDADGRDARRRPRGRRRSRPPRVGPVRAAAAGAAPADRRQYDVPPRSPAQWRSTAANSSASGRARAVRRRGRLGRARPLQLSTSSTRDFQEADQLLAGIITDFGSPTSAVPFGGRGEFDGTMTGAFNRPRVEGKFRGEDLWAWDTLWGDGGARSSSRTTTSTSGTASSGSTDRRSTRTASSRSAIRDDGGDEIDARFRIVRRDHRRLRHAFEIDEYPVIGLFSGEMHLTGPYQRPTGLRRDDDRGRPAYGQPMRKATASLRFDGRGIRLDGIDIGVNRGRRHYRRGVHRLGLHVLVQRGWPPDSGRQRRREQFKQLPISGRRRVHRRRQRHVRRAAQQLPLPRRELAVGEQEVGEVTGTLALRGNELSGDVNAASPRLALTGAGRIALTPQADCDLSFRFHDSSLDPYVRLFLPHLSANTTAVGSGSVRVTGELADIDHLVVDTTVDLLDMRLFDYALRNAAPIHMTLDRRVITVQISRSSARTPNCACSAGSACATSAFSCRRRADADLGILQGFFRDVRGSGRAELRAAWTARCARRCSRAAPSSRTAACGICRCRPRSTASTARSASITRHPARRTHRADRRRPVQFGGRIGLEGYLPGELNVTFSGQDVQLRNPEGIQSIVDADLTLRGNVKAPVLGGIVNVQSAVWTRRLDAPGSIFDLAARASAASGEAARQAAISPRRSRSGSISRSRRRRRSGWTRT